MFSIWRTSIDSGQSAQIEIFDPVFDILPRSMNYRFRPMLSCKEQRSKDNFNLFLIYCN